MNANNKQTSFTTLSAKRLNRIKAASAALLLALFLASTGWAQSEARHGSGEATQSLIGTIDQVSLSTGKVIVDGRAFGLADPRASGAGYDAGPAHATRLQQQLSRLEPGDQVELGFLPASDSSMMEGRLVSIRIVR